MLMRLGEMLIEKGLISNDDLNYALQIQRESDKLLGQVLIELNLVTEEQLLNTVAEQLNIPFEKLNEIMIDKELLNKIPFTFMEEYKFIPIKVERDNLLTIASPNPIDTALIDNMRLYFGFNINPLLTSTKDVLDFIAIHKPKENLSIKKEEALLEPEVIIKKVKQEEPGKNDPDLIKELFAKICQDGLKRKADFIYLERHKDAFHLRYKTSKGLEEGNLEEERRELYLSLTSFIKYNSIPIKLRGALKQYLMTEEIDNKRINLRICIIPTIDGEDIFIELLIDSPLPELENLFNNQKDIRLIKDIIEEKKGLFIISGPGNSAREFTLYSILKSLNTTKNEIILLGHSRYELPGINQIELSQPGEVALTQFVRDITRYEPDILVVTEPSPPELLRLLLNFTYKKRLALSILDAEDNLDAVNIFLESGLNLYKLEDTPILFISQIFVRRICPHCKEECDLSTQDLIREWLLANKDSFQIRDEQLKGKRFFIGRGCTYCNFSGYSDRMPIYEVLRLENKLRDAWLNKSSLGQLRAIVRGEGMKTFDEGIIEKLLDGVTTWEEVRRINSLPYPIK
ncbi:MAG: ATPase, T2SS/T4P/T4SS family [bacterium]